MKLTRFAAALTAVITAVMPVTINTDRSVSCTAYAEGTTLTDSVAWIPKDFDSALEFRNTYGAVHIEDGVLCVVFKREYEPLDPVNYVQNLRYELRFPGYKGTLSGYDTRSYTYSEKPVQGDTEFIVIALSSFSKGDFAIEMIDTYIDSSVPDQRYSFYADDAYSIKETDIYGWLPDCEKEYWEYANKNTNLSVKDNYVVFCLSHNAGTAYDWILNDTGKECFELETVSDCSPESSVYVDGGDINMIYTYKAVKDGYDKISYDFGPVYASAEDGKKSLVADCAVINDAQTILLSGNMRVTLVDYDTNEPITLPEGAIPRIWTDIRQSTSDGEIKCNMQPVGFRNNPAIVGLGNFFDGYNFSFGLLDIPESYSLPETEEKSAGYYNGTIVPEDHITVKKYDNNTADVVFRLKKTLKRVLPEEKSADLTDLEKGETRITFYDKDTGELIPSELAEHHNLGFGTDIRFRSNMSPDGWMYTGPVYIVNSNPQVYHTNLAKLYRSADIFEFLCDDQPEVTLYDNGAMDLVIRTRIKVSGDINGDREFNIADLVALQKWLLNAYDKELYYWAEADFDLDNKLTIFDLVLMRKALIQEADIPVAVSIRQSGGVAGSDVLYEVYQKDEKYILSFTNFTNNSNAEPIIIPISGEDYREIMSQAYASSIEVASALEMWSEIDYSITLSYEDGSQKKSFSFRFPSVLRKMIDLLDKYQSNNVSYVEPEKHTTNGSPLRVMVDDLKLYLGPDESYQAIALIPEGARLYELGYQDDNDKWLFTEYNGQYGWIKTIEDDNSTVTLYFEEYVDKPVIYLYPEKETDVHVELELTEAELSTTYPRYNNGWDVTAYPDGSLLNKEDGTHHRYLFWDAVNCRTRFDFSQGFCVAGSDTESFLKEKLTYMGLTEEEMNEFIVYWLPLMEHNAYNLIAFQGDAYTNSAKLNITPAPDSMLRVFMAYVPLENAVYIEPQQLETFERTGFTVVEWGGSNIKK